MGGEAPGEAEVDVLPSMWPDDLKNGKQFNIEKPGVNRDIQEDVNINDPSIIDFKRLLELTNYSDKGSSQLAYLVKHWEYKHANAVRLLNEELDILNKQREEVELKKLEILEARGLEEEKYAGGKRSISVLDVDEISDIWGRIPRRKIEVVAYDQRVHIDGDYVSTKYWTQRAHELEKLLEESMQREHILMQKLQENIKNLQDQSSPVEELSQILKRADNFLHFVLQNAPVVFGHQDKELRYRFIYNHFPKFAEEDIIGKTDMEIFSGIGVDEIHNFKKEVLERGKRAMQEMTFKTELFGSKTFMIYVEPVFNKAGETIGVNYMGVDITALVEQREKMAKLREEIAVQKAKETELNKSIRITEETMRAKQMLATMSHEIRSPLTGVVSMAEILANTKLDKEQRQLLDVMLSSGDLVLQLINDILDLSKVESGAMKLEATKFRPREVVKHVLQTAAASLQKDLILEGYVSDGVPFEVVGDVLRIRQILTNLISNAVKFTHKGKVGINLCVASHKHSGGKEQDNRVNASSKAYPLNRLTEDKSLKSQGEAEVCNSSPCEKDTNQFGSRIQKGCPADEASKDHNLILEEETIWLQCDVHDTGIGIPEKALPSLFKRYMQASADHARKYGGTGLGLAICKQLVELMGGHLTVTSKETHGSTFTFLLPCKIPPKPKHSDDSDEEPGIPNHLVANGNSDEITGSFLFKPSKLGKSGRLTVRQPKLFDGGTFDAENTAEVLEDEVFPVLNSPKKPAEVEVSSDKSKENGVLDFRKSNFINKGSCTRRSLDSSGSNQNHDRHSKPRSKSDGDLQQETNRQPKILLVEDNKINVMVARSMLKQMGQTIEVVSNGLEALHAFQRSDYDLILMDVCMPVMDGLQATKLIRSYEEHGFWDPAVANCIDQASLPSTTSSHCRDAEHFQKRTPIIAMTANALSESAEDCLACGMDSYISKPVTFQKLKQCLHQYLRC